MQFKISSGIVSTFEFADLVDLQILRTVTSPLLL